MKNKRDRDIELAKGWPIYKVERSLRRSAKSDLVSFLKTRYKERFFYPISVLDQIDKPVGFSIMALACLLIETFHSYRAGLPTSDKKEYQRWLGQMKRKPKANTPYYVAESEFPTSIRDAFVCFFTANQTFFPGVKGGEFYDNIRNGLLHQSQTKRGWKINVGTGTIWDGKNRTIDRRLFVLQLEKYFDDYINCLQLWPNDDDVWKNARRKIWWLAQMSKSSP